MSDDQQSNSGQMPLFPLEHRGADRLVPEVKLPADASLDHAIGAFERHMQDREFTANTQQAFRLDLQLLSDYLGPIATINEIGTATLNAFLKWMETGRGVPCSPKTLERRITTLKVFFGWIAQEGFLPRDVAAPLIHRAVSAPLPDTLSAEEIEALMRATQQLRQGTEEDAPDARPQLLLMLILNSGIKKSECMAIHVNHLDLANPDQPAIWIRYRNVRRRHKERRISLPVTWPAILNEYLGQYPTRQLLFPWTARNLEYVLTGVAEMAGVSRVTFEILRWTCAVQDYIDGIDHDALRRKLGLTKISWYEVETRLDLLSRLQAGRSRAGHA